MPKAWLALIAAIIIILAGLIGSALLFKWLLFGKLWAGIMVTILLLAMIVWFGIEAFKEMMFGKDDEENEDEKNQPEVT